MGQLSTGNIPSFRLTLTTIKLRVVPHRKNGLIRHDKYMLPDSTYGEFLILQGGKPKFLFKAFNDKGEITKLTKYLDSVKEEYDTHLIKLLKIKGYDNLSAPRGSIFSITLDKKSTLKEFEVYRIEDG